MSDSAQFALHRPELTQSLVAGEQKIAELLRGSARRYRAHHVLIEANTSHPNVYRLLDGWACRVRAIADGRDQCILIFLPGDLFAVKSMFVARHPDSVRTVSEAVIESVDYRVLHHLFLTDADVVNRCMWQVIEEERRLHNWVVGLGQGSAEERLAMLLIDFHGRLQSRNQVDGALRYRMPLTQVQIADHVGITAIHVNRVLKTFRENGIATVREGEVVIHDLERLRRLAYPLLDIYEKTAPQYGDEASGKRPFRPDPG
jgi:CRP/FNR family transcriptional regulator, anaerobic regulatory protein